MTLSEYQTSSNSPVQAQLTGRRIFNSSLIVLSFSVALLTLTVILRTQLESDYYSFSGFIKLPIGLQIAVHSINTFVALLSFFGTAIFHPVFSYKFSPYSQFNHKGPAEKFRGMGLILFGLQLLQGLGNGAIFVFFIRMAVYSNPDNYSDWGWYSPGVDFLNVMIAVIVMHPILMLLTCRNLLASYYRMLYAPSSPGAPPTPVHELQVPQSPQPIYAPSIDTGMNPYSPSYPTGGEKI